jgi:hypothetical protein
LGTQRLDDRRIGVVPVARWSKSNVLLSMNDGSIPKIGYRFQAGSPPLTRASATEVVGLCITPTASNWPVSTPLASRLPVKSARGSGPNMSARTCHPALASSPDAAAE